MDSTNYNITLTYIRKKIWGKKMKLVICELAIPRIFPKNFQKTTYAVFCESSTSKLAIPRTFPKNFPSFYFFCFLSS